MAGTAAASPIRASCASTLRVHSGGGLRLCRMRQNFRLKGILKAHGARAQPQRPFQCVRPGMRGRPSWLSTSRVHSGDRPFGCSDCGRRFASGAAAEPPRLHLAKALPVPTTVAGYPRVKADLKAHQLLHERPDALLL